MRALRAFSCLLCPKIITCVGSLDYLKTVYNVQKNICNHSIELLIYSPAYFFCIKGGFKGNYIYIIYIYSLSLSE